MKISTRRQEQGAVSEEPALAPRSPAVATKSGPDITLTLLPSSTTETGVPEISAETVRGKEAERSNWGGNLTSTPDLLVKPKTVQELQAAILNAINAGRQPCIVRGAMHSWSPIATQDGGTAIDITGLMRPPVIDKEAGTISVSGGMMLSDMYEALAGGGLALKSIPVVTSATAAGALATYVHGSDRDGGEFSEQAVEVRLIDGLGRDILIDEEGCWQLQGEERVLLVAGPKPLEQARHHRGVLGVIYEVKFKCVPAFDMEGVVESASAKKFFEGDGLREYLDAHQLSTVFWFKPQGRVWLLHADLTTEPDKPRGWFKRTVVDDFLHSKGISAALKFASKHPKLVPAINFLASRAIMGKSVQRDRSDVVQSYLPGHPSSETGLQTMEIGVPFARLEEAFAVVNEAMEGFPMPLPLEIRRVGDKVYFEFMWTDGFPGAEETARRFETGMIARFGDDARPHDAKRFFGNPWLSFTEEERADFLALKGELDPNSVYTGEYRQKYFAGEDLSGF